MSKVKLMPGMKFYRYIKEYPCSIWIPDIIKLKKQVGDKFYFDDGGYNTYLAYDELKQLIESGEFTNKVKMIVAGELATYEFAYLRKFDFFGRTIEQKWTALTPVEGARLIRFKVENIGLVMTYEEVNSNYTAIIPDGFMTMSNIDYPIDKGKDRGYDVFISLHKWGENFPFAICRQDVVDIYANDKKSVGTVCGISISQYTCPKGMTLDNFMYAENIRNMKSVAVYLEDSLNTVLKYFGSLNRYNATMRKLVEKYKGSLMTGFQDNIYDLMKVNNFYEDFKAAFGVFTYPVKFDLRREECRLEDVETAIFNAHLNSKKSKLRMKNINYYPYDRSVDVNDIDNHHMYVNTGDMADSDVFLVTYDLEDVIH